jgi:hypothetical protein
VKRSVRLIILGSLITALWAMAVDAKAGSKSPAGRPPASQRASKYSPNTGDKDLDAVLANLNIEAGEQVDTFVSELSISYAIPKVQIEDLVYTMRMPLGDVFVSVWLASTMKRSLPAVVKEYEATKDKGWGVTANTLGIEPGSEAFDSLKKDSSVELELAQKRNREKKAERSERTEKSGTKGKSKK